ncbi:hypothetical protein, partial [uncultured Selenomonas sp.]|uniref:hypothetical protein n=1 Tax=uncultured Selenomonas sp. TaxID=159275 RepID=UPI0025E80C7A
DEKIYANLADLILSVIPLYSAQTVRTVRLRPVHFSVHSIESFWLFHYKQRQDTLSIKKYIKHT